MLTYNLNFEMTYLYTLMSHYPLSRYSLKSVVLKERT